MKTLDVFVKHNLLDMQQLTYNNSIETNTKWKKSFIRNIESLKYQCSDLQAISLRIIWSYNIFQGCLS